MQRRLLVFIFLIMCMQLFAGGRYTCAYGQSVVFKDLEVKEDDNAVKILFSCNKTIPAECYDLSTPPQIIVDFMGDIYTNMPEIKMINKGVVKQMRIVKGTGKSLDLDSSYYAVDFVIFDLKEAVRYDFDQGLTNSVLNISKPGKEFPKKTMMPAPVSQPVQQVPAVTQPAVRTMSGRESETVSVSSSKTKPVQVVRPASRKKTTADVPVPKKGMMSKVKGFFGFGKKSSQEDNIKASRRHLTSAENGEKEKPRGKFKRSRRTKEAKTATKKTTRERKLSTRELRREKLRAEKIIKSSERKLERKEKDVAKVRAEFDSAKADLASSIKNVEAAQKKVDSERTMKQVAEDDVGMNMKLAEAAKDAANLAWDKYSKAKEELSGLLDRGATSDQIIAAQEKYEASKKDLEAKIKAAENAKAKIEAAKSGAEGELTENEKALLQADEEKSKAQTVFSKAQARLTKIKAEKSLIEQELAAAQRDKLKYTLQMSDKEYAKTLEGIDVAPVIEEKPDVAQKSVTASVTQEQVAPDLEQMRKEMEKDNALRDKELLRKQKVAEREARQKERMESHRRQKKTVSLEPAGAKTADREEMMRMEKAKEEARLAALQKMKEEPAPASSPAESNIEPKRRKTKTVSQAEMLANKKAKQPELLETAVQLRDAGLRMQKAGDYDAAMKYYQQALMEEPKYVSVHNDLGILYEQKGLDEKAKSEYLEALKIDPHYIRAHSNLALLYEKAGDYNKAYYHWKQRVQLGDPNDPWTLKAKQRMELLEQKRK